MEVREIDGLKMGRVDFGGALRMVCLDYVDAVPGDHVLVHVGFALSKLSAEEATDLLALLARITGDLPLEEEVGPEMDPEVRT